jgi:hypothetical protein
MTYDKLVGIDWRWLCLDARVMHPSRQELTIDLERDIAQRLGVARTGGQRDDTADLRAVGGAVSTDEGARLSTTNNPWVLPLCGVVLLPPRTP